MCLFFLSIEIILPSCIYHIYSYFALTTIYRTENISQIMLVVVRVKVTNSMSYTYHCAPICIPAVQRQLQYLKLVALNWC